MRQRTLFILTPFNTSFSCFFCCVKLNKRDTYLHPYDIHVQWELYHCLPVFPALKAHCAGYLRAGNLRIQSNEACSWGFTCHNVLLCGSTAVGSCIFLLALGAKYQPGGWYRQKRLANVVDGLFSEAAEVWGSKCWRRGIQRWVVKERIDNRFKVMFEENRCTKTKMMDKKKWTGVLIAWNEGFRKETFDGRREIF